MAHPVDRGRQTDRGAASTSLMRNKMGKGPKPLIEVVDLPQTERKSGRNSHLKIKLKRHREQATGSVTHAPIGTLGRLLRDNISTINSA